MHVGSARNPTCRAGDEHRDGSASASARRRMNPGGAAATYRSITGNGPRPPGRRPGARIDPGHPCGWPGRDRIPNRPGPTRRAASAACRPARPLRCPGGSTRDRAQPPRRPRRLPRAPGSGSARPSCDQWSFAAKRPRRPMPAVDDVHAVRPDGGHRTRHRGLKCKVRLCPCPPGAADIYGSISKRGGIGRYATRTSTDLRLRISVKLQQRDEAISSSVSRYLNNEFDKDSKVVCSA